MPSCFVTPRLAVFRFLSGLLMQASRAVCGTGGRYGLVRAVGGTAGAMIRATNIPKKNALSFPCFMLLVTMLMPRVLKSLAKHMPFELAAGLNGAFWVDSGEKRGRPSSILIIVCRACCCRHCCGRAPDLINIGGIS